MNWKFHNAIPPLGTITEGNAWDGTKLLFSNIPHNRILSFTPSTGVLEVFREQTGGANGLNFDAVGRLFACEGTGRRVARYDPNGKSITVVDRIDNLRINSPNDLAIDPNGRIWFSDRVGDCSPDVGIEYSAILRADPIESGGYTCSRTTFDTSQPNGLLFSKDYRNLYVAQSDFRASERRELRSYPVNDDGTLGNMVVLHDFGSHRGIDGMTLSTDGLIVACTGWEVSGPGGMITVFDPDGNIVSNYPTPCERPTNCTFIGEDLYVTSIQGHLLVAHDTGMSGHLIYPA